MKIAAIFLLIAAPCAAQIFGGGNARRIQNRDVKSGLPCNDADRLAWVAANSQFECIPGAGSSGVASFNARVGSVVPATNDYSFAQLSGSIAAGQIANASVPTAKLSALSGAGGTVATSSGVPADGCANWSSGNLGSTGGNCAGSAAAVPPYSTTTITASPMSITAATHAQGTLADPTCWDSSTPRIKANCGWTRASNGDIVLTYTTAPGLIQIGSGGGSTGAGALGTYLVQTALSAPANAQVMGLLGTGIVKNTTTTGVQSIATAANVADALTGTWTVNTLLKGGGAAVAPIVTGCTVDASDNLSCPGSITSGSGSSIAGAVDLAQGTLPALGTTAITLMAPTSVTSYGLLYPGAAPAAHAVTIWGAPASSVSTGAYKVIPDCTDTAGNHLNFTQSTDAFFCGTSGGSSSAFSAITGSTNTTAAMVVGTGASLAVSGSGTIAATTVTGFTPAASKILTLSNTLTFTGTDTSSVAFGVGGTVLYNGGALGTPLSGTLTNATGLPAAGVVGTAAILGANTFTGAQTVTVNGALSAPGKSATGTWITGGSATTTKPYILIEPTGTTSAAWNTNGTGLGVNAASGFTGNMLDIQLNGASSFSVRANGQAYFVGTVSFGATSVIGFTGRSYIGSSADSNITLYNNNTNNFSLLQFGGTTSSFPALKRSTTILQARLADDSAYAPMRMDYSQVGLYTVAGLPTCNAGLEGATLGATDLLAPTFLTAATGGGAVHGKVYCNGTAWVTD